MVDPAEFIRARLRLEPVPGNAGIQLYTAHARSRLSQLTRDDDPDPPPPYWAYQWAGGLALVQHFLAHPHLVAGRTLLDLGAGSGLVAIAAAQAGALASAAEIDPFGRAAIALNAAANGVTIPLVEIDLAGPPPIGFEVIAAGDVFYNPDIARAMLPWLQACAQAGLTVLVGDPGRRDLPLAALEPLASYAVGDMGDARASADRVGSVYRLKGVPKEYPHLTSP